MPALHAPRDFDPFGVADDGAWAGGGRGEEAEVVERVDCRRAPVHTEGEANQLRNIARKTGRHGRAVDVLAHRALVAPVPALIRAGLALLRDLGRVVRGVRRGVRLRERGGPKHEQ